MNLKKKIIGIAILLLAISSISEVAHAATVGYSFRLPQTGYNVTASAVKNTKGKTAANSVSSIGWTGSGIDWCVVYGNGTGTYKQLSYVGNFKTTGRKTVSYYSGYDTAYYGYSVRAKIKTDANTWHPCDIRGTFYSV